LSINWQFEYDQRVKTIQLILCKAYKYKYNAADQSFNAKQVPNDTTATVK